MRPPIGILLSIAVLFSAAAATCASAMEPASDYYRSGEWRVQGTGPHYLDVGIGFFNIGGEDESGAARIEVRFGPKFLFVGPAVGLLANLDGGYFVYGGIYTDIVYRKLVFTPAFGAGLYQKGESRDLGGNLQFRSSIGLSYQFDNAIRGGIQYAHISNADLNHKNPGEEDILLTLSIPFRF